MLVQVILFDDKGQIRLQAENAIENLLILRIANRAKTTIKTFGGILDSTGMAWCYIDIPFDKTIRNYQASRFGNYYRKQEKKHAKNK